MAAPTEELHRKLAVIRRHACAALEEMFVHYARKLTDQEIELVGAVVTHAVMEAMRVGMWNAVYKQTDPLANTFDDEVTEPSVVR